MSKLFPETMIVASADRRVCRALLRTGSRSFFAASHLLPRRVREPATALYAFCRLADDAVDLEEMAAGARRDALGRLGDRLDRAYRGVPLDQPADRAFAEAVRLFDMPRALPEALLEGLAWDAEGRRYETLSDLLSYAARVAGAVGAMMAVVMGVRDRDALARACDLGAAMQLTNIARDVGEDARAGRIYLPLAWLREEGIDPKSWLSKSRLSESRLSESRLSESRLSESRLSESRLSESRLSESWLADPSFMPAIGSVVRRLLAEADRLYRYGESGIADLPLDCRPGIRAARLLYAEIGHELARGGYDSMNRRAVVPARRKIALCVRAVMPSGRKARAFAHRPAQPETMFLVDAVTPLATAGRATLSDQVVWVFDLFARIEQRRAGRQIEGGAR